MVRKTGANSQKNNQKNNQDKPRRVTALDGEGISLPSGEHLYTLLVSYDSLTGQERITENWQSGIATEQILGHLLHALPGNGGRLPNGEKRIGSGLHTNHINVMYFGNYDVVMWLKDLPEEAKTALWKSGWVIWTGLPDSNFNRSGLAFYIRYIPSKMFFVGLLDRKDAHEIQDAGKAPEIYKWPYKKAHTLIYDVSGFAQQAFVKTLKEWDVEIGAIEHMKKERSNFTASDKRDITNYCISECRALTKVIQKMDKVFKDEGINLTSWHGGGALAGWFLKHYHAKEYIADPINPETMQAVFGAYFGGRAEIFYSGLVGKVFDYDLSSAYPWAITQLPNLKEGRWYHSDDFDAGARFALWRVSWDTSKSAYPTYAPLPYRSKARVYWGDTGQVWAHAVELKEMMRIFGPQYFHVYEGWVYAPVNPQERPFNWVRELAERRVRYKLMGDRRAVPYKYGLNSLYGKMAQHQVDYSLQAMYQSYYGAGLITAFTRASIARFIFSDGHDNSDVVMIATDGVFCKKATRKYRVGLGLGEFDFKGASDEMLLIQPGVWWTPQDTDKRTRGFGKASIGWNDVVQIWKDKGVAGRIDFEETRFIGMGSCTGWGNFSEYGRWVSKPRHVRFFPSTKWPEFVIKGREGWEENYLLDKVSTHKTKREGIHTVDKLYPMGSDPNVLSDAYTPEPPQDPQAAANYLQSLMEFWEVMEQPDLP